MVQNRLPDPAVVVLAGAAGSGKSTWAAGRYRTVEIVSSDGLRDVVGSGPGDLDASEDAFDLLDRVVAARLRRRLSTVIDTLGLDGARRRDYLARARRAGLPAVLVLLDTDPELCRRRNRARDRPVPAPVLTRQLRAVKTLAEGAASEGWDQVVRVEAADTDVRPLAVPARAVPAIGGPSLVATAERPVRGIRLVLQVSRFPWGEDPGRWLADLADTAEQVGLDGLALMDHLIQIPQVGRAWEPIPEPWVTLGFLAGRSRTLRLGTLVSPVTFRSPGIIAKTAATLDVLSGGRAFCGIGAGWWEREHAAYGLPFPPAAERLDRLRSCIETLRALWGPGTKAWQGRSVSLPETTGYPRPVGPLPIIVGGSGERRTLRIVAEQADGCNLPVDDRLPHRLAVLAGHCAAAGRDPGEVEVTVLDLPVVGRDRDDVARRVERLRGRTAAATYARRHHAGTAAEHAERYRGLADLGVRTVFVALPDLVGADDLARLAPLVAAVADG